MFYGRVGENQASVRPRMAKTGTRAATARGSSVCKVTVGADVAARFASGDPDAVRIVYQTYGRLVYAVAYKLLGDHGLAEDATQQTFLQAWRAAGSYDPARELGPWLATIARRAAIDVHRRHRRHDALDEVNPADPALLTPPSAEQTDDVWEVRRVLDALPAEDREILRLHHYGGLTHSEIADRLAIPLGTVKSRSFRAHRRLAALLGHLRAGPGSDAEHASPAPRPGPAEGGAT
jgi:RNA polymerase sigma-70 factor (ECF subfamily)